MRGRGGGYTLSHGRQPGPQLLKALQQGSLIEAEQNWILGNEILDIHFFAYQVTGKIKLDWTLISLDFYFCVLRKFNFGC